MEYLQRKYNSLNVCVRFILFLLNLLLYLGIEVYAMSKVMSSIQTQGLLFIIIFIVMALWAFGMAIMCPDPEKTNKKN